MVVRDAGRDVCLLKSVGYAHEKNLSRKGAKLNPQITQVTQIERQ